MKVAWFTPLAPQSAIGTYSRHVTERLAREAETVLWVADDGRAVQETDVPIVRYDADAISDRWLDSADVKVFNFGNYAPYHGAIYEVARAHRGIAVLHDRVLHQLFASHWLDHGSAGAERYVACVEAHYGAGPAERATAAVSGELAPPPWADDEQLVLQPLYEEAIVNAEAVITHSAAHAEEIGRHWLGPVQRLHLPCYPDVLAAARTADGGAEPRADGRLRMLAVGHVNPNKRVDRLVELLAEDEWLAARLHFDVVGSLDARPYADDLRRRVEELGDAVSVELHGAVSDAELRRRLASADVFANLRLPALESASASLLEQLAHARPTLVFDTGFFAEVPADAVARVPAGDYAGCARALRELVADAGLRQRIGAAARRAAESYSVDRYVEELLVAIEQAQRWRPALRTLDRAGEELGRLGVPPEAETLDSVVAAAGAIFAGVWAERASAEPVLRAVEDGDGDALAAFLEANDVPAVTATFDPFAMTRATAERILGEPREDRYYGAFAHDGRMVALSMLRGWDEGYEVPSLGIVVDHRCHGRGIGRTLTEWTLERARETAAPSVRLSVYADNAPARHIYDRLGFAETERVERDGGRESIVMVLQLAG